jgi:molybdate transport repressor ModE-like protein
MYKVSIDPVWRISRERGEGGEGLDSVGNISDRGMSLKSLDTQILLRLLSRIKASGSIASAVKATGSSYRHAWGMLREAEQLFGTQLLVKQPGRGTLLSPLAEALLLADQRIRARLSPTLESLASELETEISKTVAGPRNALRLYASHGFAVASLSEWIAAMRLPLEVRYRNSTEALAALDQGECDLAGFHVPLGEFEAEAVKHYTRWLDPEAHLLLQLATRNQGLFVARDNPKRITSLADLTRPQVRFVNRQAGSGTRMLLELMLKKAGIPTARINGFESTEFTHAAVAAYIASGMADVGIGVETAARRFGLDFVPLLKERYFFAIEKEALHAAPMTNVVHILRSKEFGDRIRELAGYDAADTGRILTMKEAFGKAA